MRQKKIVPIFPESDSIGPRDWGEEKLLVLSSGKYTLKKLTLKAGKKGGLQFHRFKDEAGYIVSGKMIVRFDDGAGELTEKLMKAGDWFHFPAGCVHQEEGVTDVEIIEVSTPHFNDRVRVENQYNMTDISGLPSTEENEVIFK